MLEERALGRARQEHAAAEARLTAALDGLDALKNALSGSTDAALMQQAANAHAQCARAATTACVALPSVVLTHEAAPLLPSWEACLHRAGLPSPAEGCLCARAGPCWRAARSSWRRSTRRPHRRGRPRKPMPHSSAAWRPTLFAWRSCCRRAPAASWASQPSRALLNKQASSDVAHATISCCVTPCQCLTNGVHASAAT